MARPRQLLPGRSYHITRRTLERRFRLAPTAFCLNAFLYCLGYAQEKTKVLIHAFVCMSDHEHQDLTDPFCLLPEFMRLFHRNLAKVMNQHQKFWGKLYDDRSYQHFEHADSHSLLDTVAYILANPVTAGLVSRPGDWPGATSFALIKGGTLVARRPEGYFDPDGDMPETVTVTVTTPEAFSHLSPEEYEALVLERIEARVAETRATMIAAGKKPLGAEKCRRVDPFSSPSTPPSHRKPVPLVSARSAVSRKAVLDRIRQFYFDYREALLRLRSQVRDVIFPAGTYGLRVFAGVRCESFAPE